MGEPAKKPFDYERAKALFEQEGKSPAFYNALEERMIAHERENGILDGIADLQNDPDYVAPGGPAAATSAPMAPQAAPAAPAAPASSQAATEEPDSEGGLWSDFLRGMGQGASFGLADEGAANLASLGDPWAGQRAAGRGGDAPLMTPEQEEEALYTSLLESERAANAESQDRSPWAYGAGQVAGGLPAAIATAPIAPAGAGLAVRAGQNALQGAALGMAHGYGASEGATDEEILGDAVDSGEMGGAFGAGGTLVGAGVSAAAKKSGEVIGKIADKAQRAGWRNRGVAPGTYGGEMAGMTKQHGRDVAERIGRTIEKYGAHKRPESSLLPSWVPQGPGVYADTLEVASKKAGGMIGSAVDDATAAGAQVDPRGLAMGMRDVQASHLGKGQPNDLSIANHIDTIVDDLAARQSGRGRPMTPREAWDYRHNMKPTAKLDKARNVMPEVNDKGQAYREGRDVIGEAIEGSMAPAQRASYQEGNADYGMLQKALNAALKRESQELGNQVMSINSPGAAAAGAILGGAPGAALNVGLVEGTKRVGRDVMADTLGATSKALRGAESVPRALAQAAEPAAGAASRSALPAITDDMFGGAPAMAEPLPPTPATQREAGEHPSTARVRSALNQGDPSKYLGAYAQELGDALGKGQREFGATLQRLQRDPVFMKEVWPIISAEGARP